jgi:hypothetical protein
MIAPVYFLGEIQIALINLINLSNLSNLSNPINPIAPRIPINLIALINLITLILRESRLFFLSFVAEFSCAEPAAVFQLVHIFS